MTFSTGFRKIAAASVLALMVSGAALAQSADPSPEHLALARAVIEFTGATKSFDGVVPQLVQEARSMILTTRPELKNDLDDVLPTLQAELEKNEANIVNSISKIYANHFSEEELKEIAAFYQSPTGKKLTTATPDMLRQSFGEIQGWAQKTSSEVMTRIREEMAKKGHTL